MKYILLIGLLITPVFYAMENNLQPENNIPNAGANNNQIIYDINSAFSPLFHTALMYAAAYSTKEVIVFMIEKGADTNQKNEKTGATPLHYACRNNTPEIIELLILQGASVNALNNEGQTPLYSALCNTDPANVKAFFNAIEKYNTLHKK